MDQRRVNDVLKNAGAFIGALATLGPILQKPHASVTALIVELVPALVGAVMIWLSGLGTRAPGTEYQAVADAKAIAKVVTIAPPPMAALLVTTNEQLTRDLNSK